MKNLPLHQYPNTGFALKHTDLDTWHRQRPETTQHSVLFQRDPGKMQPEAARITDQTSIYQKGRLCWILWIDLSSQGVEYAPCISSAIPTLLSSFTFFFLSLCHFMWNLFSPIKAFFSRLLIFKCTQTQLNIYIWKVKEVDSKNELLNLDEIGSDLLSSLKFWTSLRL